MLIILRNNRPNKKEYIIDYDNNIIYNNWKIYRIINIENNSYDILYIYNKFKKYINELYEKQKMYILNSSKTDIDKIEYLQILKKFPPITYKNNIIIFDNRMDEYDINYILFSFNPLIC
ncbi:unknown similar to AMEV042 [Mythimna separata entomopoxvirus 'L']|uniref:Uncharacterized protein n=1 Tax=Mythimna separata entomopoxvirus 'L' TaxID=1293572 RepID=A0A916KQ20_9POXV|nr:unknown similar to AMEV042 [Mythimna separata entomopoxvirus 'L']CCU56266.1 unknown similar to AMEV042 [Mythimna separata entomopoxvirus 'L']